MTKVPKLYGGERRNETFVDEPIAFVKTYMHPAFLAELAHGEGL